MRLKKGFTLAEILIVLMVIGAIATMTIPSLIRGVQDAQFKTAYKKAYNTILNVTAMERVNGSLPTKAQKSDVGKFFTTLASYMSVKEFAEVTETDGNETITYNSAVTVQASDSDTNPKTLGSGSSPIEYTTTSDDSPWLITDDNMAYMVSRGGGTKTEVVGGKDTEVDVIDCSNKSAITGAASAQAAFDASCVVVTVDVNGLSKAPNGMNTQASTGIAKDDTVAELTGDRYYVYIGSDGASAGPKDFTVTGRIVADLP